VILSDSRIAPIIEIEEIAMHAMVRKESFDTEIHLDEHTTADKTSHLSVESLTDMLRHILGAFEIIDSPFNLVCADFATRSIVSQSEETVINLILLEGLVIQEIFVDKAMDDIIRITADRRSEVAVVGFRPIRNVPALPENSELSPSS
jgi:hypothetical protein